jgi:hypothetical protein
MRRPEMLVRELSPEAAAGLKQASKIPGAVHPPWRAGAKSCQQVARAYDRASERTHTPQTPSARRERITHSDIERKTSMMYHVTWKVDGSPHFGIYIDPELSLNEYENEDAQAALRDGLVIVEDAIKGDSEWIKKDALTHIEASFNRELGRFDDAYSAYVEKQFEQARERSSALDNFAVGALIQVPVGDGRAYYVVEEVNKRTCILGWRGYSEDRWHDQVLGWGGKFALDRIEPLWLRDRALNELFGRPSA